jgi:hypothetical protein
MTADLERAARALATLDYGRDIWDELLENEDEWNRRHTNNTPLGVRDEYRAQARAVLSAVLADPSEAMVERMAAAANDVIEMCQLPGDRVLWDDRVDSDKDDWRRAMRAALIAAWRHVVLE